MLSINRTAPEEFESSTYLKATVALRDENNQPIEGSPDLKFEMETYQKISKVDGKSNEVSADDEDGILGDDAGEKILLPVNMFFATLTPQEHKDIYDLYRYAKDKISAINDDNKRDIQKLLQDKIYKTVKRLNLSSKMVAFCATPVFEYPDLTEVGKAPHHTPEMTFLENDYVEITAISLLCKMMVPIWGDFVKQLSLMNINPGQREKLSLDLIEPTLEEGAFTRIYNKLCFKLSTMVKDVKIKIDKSTIGGASVSFILTHNAIDDSLFESMVMATIIVKGMATYECMTRVREGKEPNAMVYIDDRIKKTAKTRIQTLRSNTNTMPRRENNNHGDDDNTSILDHASTNSKKSIDVAMVVTTAAEIWELDRLIKDSGINVDVFTKAADFYVTNPWDFSPLRDVTLATFIGSRLGGSKCIKYLDYNTYRKFVTVLQTFLIENGFIELAALVTCKTPEVPLDIANNMRSRLESSVKSKEYLMCQNIFKQYLDKPVIPYGKNAHIKKNVEVEKIDFTNQISRIIDWLVDFKHMENMAPIMWEAAGVENPPFLGADCKISETVTADLCKFYLLFHENGRPF